MSLLRAIFAGAMAMFGAGSPYYGRNTTQSKPRKSPSRKPVQIEPLKRCESRRAVQLCRRIAKGF